MTVLHLLVWGALGLILGTELRAEDARAVNLRDRFAVEFAMMDYPKLHAPWLREQLTKISKDREPLLWARACWGLALASFPQDKAWMNQHLADCQRIAQEQQLTLEWATFRLADEEGKQADESAQFFAKVQPILEQIRHLDDPDAHALAAARLASMLLDIRDIDRAMPYVLEANELVESGKSQSLMVWETTKTSLSTALDYQGKLKESAQVDVHIIQRLAEQKTRKALAQAHYNRGFTRIFQDPPDAAAVQADMTEALRIAQPVEDDFTIGNVLYAQSLIKGRAQQFSAATIDIKKALQIFERIEDLHWVVVCKMLWAEFLLNQKKYAETIALLDEVDQLVSRESRLRKNYIVGLRYRIAKEQGDWKKALQYLEAHAKEERAMADIREKDAYNHASVSLGLQLEHEKTNLLRQENQIQAQKLQEAERFRLFVIVLGCLSLSTLSLLILAFRQIRKIRASKQKIQLILDNIDEGLLTIDRQQRIGSDYSRHLRTLVAPDDAVAGRDFMDTIFPGQRLPAEQKAIIREVLSVTFGEEELAWSMNSANLPAEIRLQEPKAAIHVLRWIPIYDHAGRLDQLLVSLVDVTAARAMEETLGIQEKRLKALPDTLREILQAKPERLRSQLKSTDQLLTHWDGMDRAEALRQLHTEKGAARTLGLQSLSQQLHDLESQWNTEHQPIVWAAARATVQEYQSLSDVLGQGSDRSCFWLPAALDPHLQAWMEQLAKARLDLESIQISDDILRWDEEDAALIRELCLHAINNSLDHGFILPQKRGQTVRQPRLHIRAYYQGSFIRVELQDNGVGLDDMRLRQLANARSFTPGPGETWADVLFLDGTSTAETVTLTSGRGVGLAAIKARVRKRGGAVGIQNQETGTLLWLELPVPVNHHIRKGS